MDTFYQNISSILLAVILAAIAYLIREVFLLKNYLKKANP